MGKEPESVDESNNDRAIPSEEGIELDEMVDQPKREIECVNCEERFDSIVNLDEHLITKHRMDREKLSTYLKWHSNEISKTQGKN